MKLVLLACLVACARAGDLLQQPLQLASPGQFAQIRYAPGAPLISKSTIYHHAPTPAIAYHSPAPTVVAGPQLVKTIAPASYAYQAQAPIAYHSPAPTVVAGPQLVKTISPATYAYQAQSPIAYQAQAPIAYQAHQAPIAYHAPAPIAYHAPAPIAYHQAPAIAYQSAPLIKTIASAPIVKTIAPVPTLVKAAPVEEYDPNPQYSFGYDVHDSLTGDIKSQSETRNGDTVQGSYALNEPDGTRRIVDYTADPINGFNAVVRKEPLEQKTIIAAPVAKFATAPVAYSAPVATPLAYGAPVAKLAYAAPAHTYYSH